MKLRARRSTSGRERPPGDVLVRPIALAALALLILNDHVLKSAFPGPLTGKLSDVAGLMLFPIVLVAGWELGARLIGRRVQAGPAAMLTAVMVTGLAFALVKTLPAAADAFGRALGAAQWLIALPAHAALGRDVPALLVARVIADPTDLLALPALVVAWWVGSSSTRTDAPSNGPMALTTAVAPTDPRTR